jgi:hypothetical protein
MNNMREDELMAMRQERVEQTKTVERVEVAQDQWKQWQARRRNVYGVILEASDPMNLDKAEAIALNWSLEHDIEIVEYVYWEGHDDGPH